MSSLSMNDGNKTVQTPVTDNSVQTMGVDKTQDKPISNAKLVVMWGIILLGYFLFVVQWYSIGNFAPGYNSNIGTTSDVALNSMPNWTITLMRGVGSILAGWLLAKVGHKWAVTIVLTLMVLAFPYLIVVGIKWPGTPNLNGTAFGLFLFFRLFLAIGGTTLITYTNSVIAKMPVEKRPTFMSLNQIGYNGGAFFANIFFVFGLGSVINSKPEIWLTILSVFVGLIAILLVVYVIMGVEVVPRQKKNSGVVPETTFGQVFKDGYTWKMSSIFIIWLVIVVFINSGSMRSFVENSPMNIYYLVEWNLANGKTATSMAGATLSTSTSVVVGSGFNWIWPTYICLFVGSFLIGFFVISPFNKTIYKRKTFINFSFAIAAVFCLISLLCGYLGGYGNKAALSFFFIFIFLSGIFSWGVQPVLLALYQQHRKSNPTYAGIIAGIIWGVGYVGYTIVELTLSLALSYWTGSGSNSGAVNAGIVKNAVDHGKKLMDGTANGMGTTIAEAVNGSKLTLAQTMEKLQSTGYLKGAEQPGTIFVIVMFFVIWLAVFPIIFSLPEAGVKDKDGNFKEFNKPWNFVSWNFRNPDILIKKA